MPRYIDADALIFKLKTQDYSCAPDTLEDWTPEDMTRAEIADIEHAPTADVVEVVRCKDCRFYETNQDECVFYNAQWVKHDDDFCPYGERREDDRS